MSVGGLAKLQVCMRESEHITQTAGWVEAEAAANPRPLKTSVGSAARRVFKELSQLAAGHL